MRLSEFEINKIKRLTKSIFGIDAQVFLFGSRVLDTAKGGDLDLLIRTQETQNKLNKKLKFLALLKKEIGDQKIDLIIRSFDNPDSEDIIFLDALQGSEL